MHEGEAAPEQCPLCKQPASVFKKVEESPVKSKLFSPSDIQRIMKKAMVERMKQSYKKEWLSEDGAPFLIRVSIMKDEVTVGLDTSGESLHKSGYRKLSSKAPITETLAAALILLTPWREDRILVDIKTPRLIQFNFSSAGFAA